LHVIMLGSMVWEKKQLRDIGEGLVANVKEAAEKFRDGLQGSQAEVTSKMKSIASKVCR
jgi:hypothetical protein